MGHDTGALTVTVAAPVARIVDVLLDIDRYPQWQRIMKEARVLERDDEGRPLLASFCVDAKVRRVRYVSRYRYDLPRGFSWDLERGDLAHNSGSYTFRPRSDAATEVDVQIAFDPGFYVPGPVRALVQGQSLRITMRELRARVEG